MTKPFELLAQRLPVKALLDRVTSNPWLWGMNRERQQQSPEQAQSEAIILRWSAGAKDAAASHNTQECENQPIHDFLAREVGPLLMEAIHYAHDCLRIGRVMITRLPPGGRISEHADEGFYADGYCRFHVCLTAGKRNYFEVGGQEFAPEPGEMWWFNHKLPHRVWNDSDEDRIHLIIDLDSHEFRQRMGVYCQLESFFYLWDEVQPLLTAHWHEVAKYPDIPLAPDLEMYELMQQRGRLRCFTCRDRGVLVGYAAFFVYRHAHYDVKIAQQDVLFLAKEARSGRVGLNLIKYAEQRLKAEGVDLVTHHVKTTNGVQKVLERMGYEEVDRVLIKRVKG